MTEQVDLARACAEVVEAGRYVHARGLTHGSTGNISIRVDGQIVVTPTGKSLCSLAVDDLAVIDLDGNVLSNAKPSKEAVLHASVYRARPEATAVVHTHSLYSTAVSCLSDIDESNALPPLTAYYAMRVGRLPVIPFYPPGDAALATHAGRVAETAHSMLFRNHGPLVAATRMDRALDIIEELEQTAQLYLLLDGKNTSPVGANEAQHLFNNARS